MNFPEPGGLVPVLTEPPSCGSFLYNKVEEGRGKKEEERGKIVFESVTFSDFAYYNSRENKKMCNFADRYEQ